MLTAHILPQPPMKTSPAAPPRVDTFTVNAGRSGSGVYTAHVVSETLDRHTGQPHQYNLCFRDEAMPTGKRFHVLCCGPSKEGNYLPCIGWDRGEACRHADALDRIVNQEHVRGALLRLDRTTQIKSASRAMKQDQDGTWAGAQCGYCGGEMYRAYLEFTDVASGQRLGSLVWRVCTGKCGVVK